MLRTKTLYTSGHRPNLVLGGDRELVLVSGLLSFVLVFAGFVAHETVVMLFGVAFWFCALYALRKMAKADPALRRVYLKHIKYKKAFYPARSTPFRMH